MIDNVIENADGTYSMLDNFECYGGRVPICYPPEMNDKTFMAFCKTLSFLNPVSIRRKPERLWGDKPRPLARCYQNALDYSDKVGYGMRVMGWLVEKMCDVYLFANHHAVWTDGEQWLDFSVRTDRRHAAFVPCCAPGDVCEHYQKHGSDIYIRYFPCHPRYECLVRMKERMDRLEDENIERWRQEMPAMIRYEDEVLRKHRRRSGKSGGRSGVAA
jgi:hypothetical protein